MQPKKPPEETECQLCHKQITSKYSWQVRISYCNGGGFYKQKICRDCVAKLTGMPTDRMRFEEVLREYRMEFKISMYHNEHIDPKHLQALKARLDYKKIPIKNYGIPLYYLHGDC